MAMLKTLTLLLIVLASCMSSSEADRITTQKEGDEAQATSEDKAEIKTVEFHNLNEEDFTDEEHQEVQAEDANFASGLTAEMNFTPRPLCPCVEPYRGGDGRVAIDNCFWCKYKSMNDLKRTICKKCSASVGDTLYLETWQTCLGTGCYREKGHCSRPTTVGVTYDKEHFVNALKCPPPAGGLALGGNSWDMIQGVLAANNRLNSNGGVLSSPMYSSDSAKAKANCKTDYTAVFIEHWRTCTGPNGCYHQKTYTCEKQYSDVSVCLKTVLEKNGVTYSKAHQLSFVSCKASEDR